MSFSLDTSFTLSLLYTQPAVIETLCSIAQWQQQRSKWDRFILKKRRNIQQNIEWLCWDFREGILKNQTTPSLEKDAWVRL